MPHHCSSLMSHYKARSSFLTFIFRLDAGKLSATTKSGWVCVISWSKSACYGKSIRIRRLLVIASPSCIPSIIRLTIRSLHFNFYSLKCKDHSDLLKESVYSIQCLWNNSNNMLHNHNERGSDEVLRSSATCKSLPCWGWHNCQTVTQSCEKWRKRDVRMEKFERESSWKCNAALPKGSFWPLSSRCFGSIIRYKQTGSNMFNEIGNVNKMTYSLQNREWSWYTWCPTCLNTLRVLMKEKKCTSEVHFWSVCVCWTNRW